MAATGGDEEWRVRDDLGARLLDAHPRARQWHQLDVTVAALTFDQLTGLADRRCPATELDPVRGRVIAGINDELAGRLGSRWVRWSDTFGLPHPDLHAAPRDLLVEYPYRLAGTGQVDDDYLRGVSAVFDAGLGIAAAGTDEAGMADYQQLTAPWRWACLPSPFTPATAYGPYTQAGLALLRQARDAGPDTAARVLAARTAIDPETWRCARDQVAAASLDSGYPYRSRCLFWEAVPAAEDSADQSPTDPGLAEALWAAAATHIFTGRLPDTAAETLLRPWHTVRHHH